MKTNKFISSITSTKKKRVLVVVVLILAALAAFRIVTSNIENKPEVISDVVNIRVTEVIETTLETTAPLSGRISPVNEVSVIPLIGGQIQSVSVTLGDKVAAGAVLFQIDATQAQTAYDQANESYLTAKAAYDRMQVLYNEGVISLQDLESVKLQHEMARQSKIMAADSLSNTTVTAPIDGYVTSVNVERGGMASQALPAVTIADISRVEIEASVSEQLINKIKLDDTVQILVPAALDHSIPGRISALSPAPAAGSLTYPIIVTVDNPDTLVKPGMAAEIIVVAEKNENAIVIPSNAVMIKGGRTIAAVVGTDGKVAIRDVEIGIDNGTQAQILSGLSVGEKVVIEGQQYIDENTKIQIVE